MSAPLYTWTGDDEAVDGPEALRSAEEAFYVSAHASAIEVQCALFSVLTESQQERVLQALEWQRSP